VAVKYLDTNWKDDLKTRVFPTERIYIDFRQEIYPPYGGEMIRANILDGILLGDILSEDKWKYLVDGILMGESITGTVTT
jgi:hypothetical protein